MMWALVVILLLISTFIGTQLLMHPWQSDESRSTPPAFLNRLTARFQPLLKPVLETKGLVPSSFPPIEVVTLDAPYPGTLLLTNATNPVRDDCETHFNRYIAEIDKYSGKLLRYRRILTTGYLFQPQSEGYSYAILEKVGVNGGGHDGTHYLTD